MVTMIKPFVIGAVLYYVAGMFGLTLAIPPGFASAVWPAAGFALAWVLLMSPYPAAIGIALGSLMVNLWVATNGYAELSSGAIQTASLIAVGALLQSLFSRWLFVRFVGAVQTGFESPSSILRLLLLVAPFGCLVGASVGVTALSLNQLIETQNILFSWFTWWVGDTIGVILFCPLLLTLASQNSAFNSVRRMQILIPSVLLFVCVLLLFYSSLSNRDRLVHQEIEDRASRFFIEIETRLHKTQNILRSYEAFYRSSNHVNREEFDSFSKVILEEDDIFQAVGWVERVQQADRLEVESRMRSEGYPGFSIVEPSEDKMVPAGQREDYYAVLILHPLEGNERALGLDLGYLESRRSVLVRAEKTREMQSTAPITLVQEKEQQRALILYLPVYQRLSAESRAASGQGDELLQGYISGVVRVSGLVGGLVEQIKQVNMGVVIEDVTQFGQSETLVQSELANLKKLQQFDHTISFGGRKLHIRLYADTAFSLASKGVASWFILTIGLLVVALIQAFILLLTGTTERISSEVQRKTLALKEARDAADLANQAKSHFLANMSHEIRTPLNAILGFIKLCSDTSLTDQQKQYLKNARLSSETLLGLINESLDFAKIEAKSFRLALHDFDFPKLIQKMHAIFSHQARQRGLAFKIELPPAIPGCLVGDALRIEQVLINLLGNAMKFTAEGAVTLSIFTERVGANQFKVSLIVADTGVGISPEMQELVFKPFQQADPSISRKFGGTGLGLSITRELVLLMGGTVTLESALKQGSRFQVTLTLDEGKGNELVEKAAVESQLALGQQTPGEQEPRHKETTTEQDQSAPTADDRLEGLSILLVEDVAFNQMIAQLLLEQHRAKVTLANHGKEALDILAQRPFFDVILMDIQMPVMDGMEATKRIKLDSEYSEIPVIAMTANVMESDRQIYLAAGMVDMITKPIDEEDLINIILRHAGK